MQYSREDLVSVLKRNVVDVNFIKTDGTQRKMKCTLKEDFLPEEPETTNKKAVNLAVIPVWDLDKEAWRSFRVDSVTSIHVDQYEMDV